ncbi:hypothetical protein MKY59_04295 [Paenibacillus sp. FSL W8-0426]|uniref:hypothetical protein n=1 Tax=Paenibacillus sp. FSL W8-0426 TaxID=2921714 RepID=UPI0030D986BF
MSRAASGDWADARTRNAIVVAEHTATEFISSHPFTDLPAIRKPARRNTYS